MEGSDWVSGRRRKGLKWLRHSAGLTSEGKERLMESGVWGIHGPARGVPHWKDWPMWGVEHWAGMAQSLHLPGCHWLGAAGGERDPQISVQQSEAASLSPQQQAVSFRESQAAHTPDLEPWYQCVCVCDTERDPDRKGLYVVNECHKQFFILSIFKWKLYYITENKWKLYWLFFSDNLVSLRNTASLWVWVSLHTCVQPCVWVFPLCTLGFVSLVADVMNTSVLRALFTLYMTCTYESQRWYGRKGGCLSLKTLTSQEFQGVDSPLTPRISSDTVSTWKRKKFSLSCNNITLFKT